MACEHCGAPARAPGPGCPWGERNPEAAAAGFDAPCYLESQFRSRSRRRDHRRTIVWLAIGTVVLLSPIIVTKVWS